MRIKLKYLNGTCLNSYTCTNDITSPFNYVETALKPLETGLQT
ncbi:hypothetical protein EV146_104275 [Mesobacillus foraminis]|uniref:Uncharacterized protein n=1 Tax=Mesobacillus foraminis TaxID=279826 RepID=A0A4R2BGJ1_9BACI|nr:hypothetical protein EV146_104275 [Mesobacillus foraminis]